MKQISIVIVTYNSTKDIQGCLKSVYDNNDLGDNLEVIVVDNNSNDIDTLKDILTTDFPQVILIENSKNGGYGQGNNVGIRQSTAPVIMIMNPDVRLFMPVFKSALVSFKCHNCAMVGMQQFEKLNKLGQSILPLNLSIASLIRFMLYKKFNIYNQNYCCFSGASFFLDKSKFEKIGLFDEEIFMYGEELDINFRIRKHRYGIVYNKEIGYIHPLHQRKLSLNTLIKSYESYLYNHKKHNINIYKGISRMIRYMQLLRLRAYLSKAKDNVSIYDSFIQFLKMERKKCK